MDFIKCTNTVPHCLCCLGLVGASAVDVARTTGPQHGLNPVSQRPAWDMGRSGRARRSGLEGGEHNPRETPKPSTCCHAGQASGHHTKCGFPTMRRGSRTHVPTDRASPPLSQSRSGQTRCARIFFPMEHPLTCALRPGPAGSHPTPADIARRGSHNPANPRVRLGSCGARTPQRTSNP